MVAYLYTKRFCFSNNISDGQKIPSLEERCHTLRMKVSSLEDEVSEMGEWYSRLLSRIRH